jgi:hypothetical protein
VHVPNHRVSALLAALESTGPSLVSAINAKSHELDVAKARGDSEEAVLAIRRAAFDAGAGLAARQMAMIQQMADEEVAIAQANGGQAAAQAPLGPRVIQYHRPP